MIEAFGVVDRLELDGRTLLLLQTQVVELSPLALAAYDAVAGGAGDVVSLADALVAAFGAPAGDATAAVRGVVDELASLGLVTAPEHT